MSLVLPPPSQRGAGGISSLGTAPARRQPPRPLFLAERPLLRPRHIRRPWRPDAAFGQGKPISQATPRTEEVEPRRERRPRRREQPLGPPPPPGQISEPANDPDRQAVSASPTPNAHHASRSRFFSRRWQIRGRRQAGAGAVAFSVFPAGTGSAGDPTIRLPSNRVLTSEGVCRIRLGPSRSRIRTLPLISMRLSGNFNPSRPKPIRSPLLDTGPFCKTDPSLSGCRHWKCRSAGCPPRPAMQSRWIRLWFPERGS